MKEIADTFFVTVGSCIIAAFIVGFVSTRSSDSTIAISPPSARLNASVSTIVTLTASGGDSYYTWYASSSSLGTLHTTGKTALYQSTTNAGTNTITVSDTCGYTGRATIIQE